MVTLEQAARAWTALGRVMYPSLAEVEASLAEVQAALAGQAHSTGDGADARPMTSQQTHESEED